MFFEELVNR